MRIGIVGAGMAGLACAEGLARYGYDVVLFDKGNKPGGRMSTRRMATSAGDAYFDHGAQYFTVRDAGFQRRVNDWIAEGLVAPWPSAGPEAYVGAPAMNAPIRQMAAGQTVHWKTTVTRIESHGSGWRLFLGHEEIVEVELAVVAVPAEQARALIASVAPDFAAHATAAQSEPCWTAMLAFSEPVAVKEDCWKGGDVIGWAARNSSKPGRFGPESWIVQAGPAWSRTHLEADPDWVSATLKAALSNLVGTKLPPSIGETSHRWRFARSGADGSGALLDCHCRLGICGDWLIGPRVESAWLSGTILAKQIGVADGIDPEVALGRPTR